MAATDFSWGGYPVQGGDIPIKNTDGSNNFAVGDAVKMDSTNYISNSGQPQIGAVGGAAAADFPLGLMIEAVAQLAMGRVRTVGFAQGNAAGAITAGAIVGLTASRQITTYTAANPSLGQAMNTTVNAADPCLVHIQISKNA